MQAIAVPKIGRLPYTAAIEELARTRCNDAFGLIFPDHVDVGVSKRLSPW